MLASLVEGDYVFSNELYGEAALYTVAASLPGFSSGMHRALTDGETYALKTVQGTYVYRMKGVLTGVIQNFAQKYSCNYKWNHAIFTLEPDRRFNIDFIWNQEWQDQVDRLNKEEEQKDPDYKAPRWPWREHGPAAFDEV